MNRLNTRLQTTEAESDTDAHTALPPRPQWIQSQHTYHWDSFLDTWVDDSPSPVAELVLMSDKQWENNWCQFCFSLKTELTPIIRQRKTELTPIIRRHQLSAEGLPGACTLMKRAKAWIAASRWFRKTREDFKNMVPKSGKRDRSDIVKLGGPADVRAIFTRARHFVFGPPFAGDPWDDRPTLGPNVARFPSAIPAGQRGGLVARCGEALPVPARRRFD
jgi:hypothetical protein